MLKHAVYSRHPLVARAHSARVTIPFPPTLHFGAECNVTPHLSPGSNSALSGGVTHHAALTCITPARSSAPLRGARRLLEATATKKLHFDTAMCSSAQAFSARKPPPPLSPSSLPFFFLLPPFGRHPGDPDFCRGMAKVTGGGVCGGALACSAACALLLAPVRVCMSRAAAPPLACLPVLCARNLLRSMLRCTFCLLLLQLSWTSWT
jgi:hypothetical protein